MKHMVRLILICMWLTNISGYIRAQQVKSLDPDTGIFYLRTSDGHEDCEVDGSLIFKCVKSGNIPMSRSAGVCFSPKNPGDIIQVTFDEIDLDGSSNYLALYNGYVQIKWPTPSGYFSKVGKEAVGQTVQSDSPDGKLTIALHTGYSTGGQKGWTITVRSVTPSQMVYAGISADQSRIKPAFPGKAAQPLLVVNIRTEGRSEPLSLSQLGFNLAGTTSLQDIRDLRVYYTGREENLTTETGFGLPVETAADTFSVAGSQVLQEGNNYFWLVADVIPSAVPAHTLDAACISALVNGEQKVNLPLAPEGNISIDNTVLLSAVPTIYRVGTDTVSFYDDGGKEEKISKNFSGQVTFIPVTPGNKIQIDFKKVSLASSGQDLLKVFNGSEADENFLHTWITESEPVVVRSVAPDGSLTVSLVSTSYFPGDGFEAAVSEFTPRPMVLKDIVPVQVTDGTVSAGDTGQPILAINLRTENTEPALTLSQLSFTAGGTSGDVSKASLYYTGKSSVFSSAVRLFEIPVTDDNFEFVFEEPRMLAEGDNYYWVAYDIKEDAVSGGRIDAGLVKAVLSDGEHVLPDGNPDGDRVLKNEYVSTLGTTEKTIFGTWTFTHTHASDYSDKYKPQKGDQITVFVPGTPGNSIELDFSSFDVYYSSSDYGTRAKFEIYSGKGISGPLLWKLDSAEKGETGPDGVLTSLADDGCMTVVFDANTTYTSYTGNGWMGEVRDVRPARMEINRITAFQASIDPVSIQATGVETIGMEIVTEGYGKPVTLDEIVLDLKGCEKWIKEVSVYATGTRNTFTEPVLVAQGEGTAGNTVLTLAEPFVLPAGSSYFWVAYDMKEEVEAGLSIDAALISVQADEERIEPVTGDPEGERLTRNAYYLTSGDCKTVTVDAPVLFYDDGGSENDYSGKFSGQVTFVPKNPDQVIRLTFRRFWTDINHELKIYEGGTLRNLPDARYAGDLNDDLPGDFVSKADDGKLTVTFSSVTSGFVSEGWEIEVSTYTLQPLTPGKIAVTAVSPVKLFRGATDVPVLKVEVEVVGDKGLLGIEQLSFSTDGTTGLPDIKRARVFCTDTADYFAPVESFGVPAEEGTYVFSDRKVLTAAGTYRFWLTYDISPEALTGHVVAAKLTGLIAEGRSLPVGQNEESRGVIADGFSGTYIVGSSPEAHYPTLGDAVGAMKEGIDGPVVFELENGVYRELIDIPDIPGASPENTITVRSQSGCYADVTICYDDYKKPAYSDDQMFYEYGVFTVAGADYLTLEGITLTNSDGTFPSVVHVKNASRHVTVRNCHVYAPLSTDYWNGINLVYMYARSEANRNNDYFTLENCLLEGGYNGIRFGGTYSVELPKEQGGRVIGNTFLDQGSIAVYAMKEVDGLIEGNTIGNDRTDKSGYKAIDAVMMEGMTIRNNVIRLATGNIAYGLYLRARDNISDSPARIYNNEINFMSTTGASYGIHCTDQLIYTEIVHNTIRMSGTSQAPSSAVFYSENKAPALPSHVRVTNNIFQHLAGGYVFHLNQPDIFGDDRIVFSHNACYTNESGSFVRAEGSVRDFDDWRSISGDTTGFVQQVEFLSEMILEPGVAGRLNQGIAIPFVTTDIAGISRNEATPTIGAYEYVDSGEAPELVSGYPQPGNITHTGANFLLNASLAGKAFYLVREAADTVPSFAEMLASPHMELRRGKDVSVGVDGLTSQTAYKLYVALQSLRGINSDTIWSIPFVTSYPPTEVSTFETVKITEGDFTDGTASFTGFVVESVTDGVGTNNGRAARLKGTGRITITNSVKGLVLTGFYLKSDVPVGMEIYQGETPDPKLSVELPATGNKWIFCNLKDKGEITSVALSGEGKIWIDNFSGEPQPLFCIATGGTADEGMPGSLSAEVRGGVPPYTYEWKNALRESLSSAAVFTFEAVHTAEYLLTVTDAWNRQATAKAVVKVTGHSYTATFEDLRLDAESYWKGDDEGVHTFYSGSYAFSNYLSSKSWAQFGYSNRTSTVFHVLDDQYNSVAGCGAGGSSNYAVAYVDTKSGDTKVSVMHRTDGDTIQGCYVTNTAWVENAILNGDDLSAVEGGFDRGDYFVLTATGKKGAYITGTCDFYLADYRPEKETDRYYVDSWQWFDLRPLGVVTDVVFTLRGTKANAMGLTTPAYFCMDDFNGKRVIDEAAGVRIGLRENRFDLASFFVSGFESATVVYRIEDPCDTEIARARIEGNDLVLTGNRTGATDLVVSEVRKGRKAFVRIPVTVVDGQAIMAPAEDEILVYPVPVSDRLHVSTGLEKYTVEAITLSGHIVLWQRNNRGDAVLDVSGLDDGTYLLRITAPEGTFIKRFTKIR